MFRSIPVHGVLFALLLFTSGCAANGFIVPTAPWTIESAEASTSSAVAANQPPVESVAEPAAETQSIPALVAKPARLKIPALDVDAIVEGVGRTAEGAMEIPTYVEDVAWYSPGAAPGDIGNAVIAGHRDAIGYVPAVFYKLDTLQPGDQVIVSDENGTEHTFAVTRSEIYPYEETPFDEVFGVSLRSNLNLITCNGSWNRDDRNYSNRLVVFTEKISTSQDSTSEISAP